MVARHARRARVVTDAGLGGALGTRGAGLCLHLHHTIACRRVRGGGGGGGGYSGYSGGGKVWLVASVAAAA